MKWALVMRVTAVTLAVLVLLQVLAKPAALLKLVALLKLAAPVPKVVPMMVAAAELWKHRLVLVTVLVSIALAQVQTVQVDSHLYQYSIHAEGPEVTMYSPRS